MKTHFDRHLDNARKYGKQHWKPLLIGLSVGIFIKLVVLLVLVALVVWGVSKLRKSKNPNKRGELYGNGETST